MQISNFWFYLLVAFVVLHVIIAFVYLIYKIEKKPKKKENNNKKT